MQFIDGSFPRARSSLYRREAEHCPQPIFVELERFRNLPRPACKHRLFLQRRLSQRYHRCRQGRIRLAHPFLQAVPSIRPSRLPYCRRVICWTLHTRIYIRDYESQEEKYQFEIYLDRKWSYRRPHPIRILQAYGLRRWWLASGCGREPVPGNGQRAPSMPVTH